jgi:DNA-binding transcriptional LysR family regulator
MNRRTIDILPDMALFVSVARHQGVTKAGLELGMPASTVSRRLVRFEKAVGFPLFVRSAGPMQLTEAATTLLAHCVGLVDAAEAAEQEFDRESTRPEGRLRVEVTSELTGHILHAVLPPFAAAHPEIALEVLTPSRSAAEARMATADVVLHAGQPFDIGMTTRVLGRVPLGLFAAPSYLEARGRPRSPEALAKHVCLRRVLGGKAERFWELRQGGDQATVTVDGSLSSNSLRVLRTLSEGGLGVAPSFVDIATSSVRAGRLEHVLEGWFFDEVPIHAISPSRLLSRKARLLLDAVSGWFDGDRCTAVEVSRPPPARKRRRH